MSGSSLDRAYMRSAGVADHKKVRKMPARARNKASDPDLKAPPATGSADAHPAIKSGQ